MKACFKNCYFFTEMHNDLYYGVCIIATAV